MKRRWGLLVAALVVGVLALGVGGTATGQTTSAPDCSTVGYDGEGTGASPYEVTNVSQLQCIDGNHADATDRSDALSSDYALVDDVDASGTSEWNGGAGFEPIGGSGAEFTGTFDGQGNDIEGLVVDRPTESLVGLFRFVDGTTVENVNLVDVDISGDGRTGAIVGYNDRGTVANSTVTGEVTGSGTVGAIVGGNLKGTVDNSSAAADIVDAGDFVGGLVGWNRDGTVSESAATGDVDGDRNVGGLVGVNGGTVVASSATGDVSGTEDGAGGLVGANGNGGGEVINSSARGAVDGEKSVGGLVGENDGGDIEGSFATGTVTGVEFLGGLVGENGEFSTATVRDSYATGSVKDAGFSGGGLVGKNHGEGIVNRTFATGNVSGMSAGGLVGDNLGTIGSSYWDDEAATVIKAGTEVDDQGVGQGDDSGVTGLTTAEMSGLNATDNMVGFAFPDGEGTWHVTDSYPALAWEDTGPYYAVTITDTNSLVAPGETLNVTTNVTNWGADGGDQTIELLDFDDTQQDTSQVSLTSGGSTELTLSWETEDSDAGSDNVTVLSEDDTAVEAVEIGDPITYSDLSINKTTIADGEPFDVSATVTNEDESNERDYTAEFKKNGTVVDTITGSIAAGGNTSVDFETSFNTSGTQNVTIADLPAETITVEETITYSDLTVSDTTVVKGEAFDVFANVTNNDESDSREYTAELKQNGTVVDTQSGTIAAGENAAVGFTTSIDTAGTYDVTIADLPAETVEVNQAITYSELAVSETTVVEGEAFDVSAVLTNNDDSTDRSYTAELKQNGTVVDTQSDTVAAGANTTVSFTTSIDTAGTYDVTIADLPAETVEVNEAITYSDLTVSDTTVVKGEAFDVFANVTNNDESDSREYTAELKQNGTVVDTFTGSLSAGADTSVVFTTSFNNTGTQNVTIADLPAETITVEETITYSELAVSETTVVENESFDVGAVLTNNDDSTDRSFTVELKQNGTVIDTQSGTIAAGANTTVSFTTSIDTAGTYDVTIADLPAETVQVQAPPFFAVNVTETNEPVVEGEPLEVTANVTNTGDVEATQTVTLNDTAFTDTERDATEVTLAGGTTESVVLEWTTATGDAGTGDVTVASDDDADSETVAVQAPAAFDVTVTETNAPVVEGETLSVTATVTNTGDAEATQTITLTDTGFTATLQDASEVTLAGGATESVVLEWTTSPGDSGAGDVTAASDDDSAAAAVTVQAPAAFELDVAVPDESVLRGETITVEAAATNVGDVAGSGSVTVAVDGSEVRTVSVDVPPADTETVTVEWDTEDVTMPVEDDGRTSRGRGDDSDDHAAEVDVTVEVGDALATTTMTVECIDDRDRSRDDPPEAVCEDGTDDGRDDSDAVESTPEPSRVAGFRP